MANPHSAPQTQKFHPSILVGLVLLPIVTSLALISFLDAQTDWREISATARIASERAPVAAARLRTGIAMDRLEAISYRDLLASTRSSKFEGAVDDFYASIADLRATLETDSDDAEDEALRDELRKEIVKFLEDHAEINEPGQVPEASWRYFDTIGWPVVSTATGQWTSFASGIQSLQFSAGYAFDLFDSVIALLFSPADLERVEPSTAAWISSNVAAIKLEAAATAEEPLEERSTLRILNEALDPTSLEPVSPELAKDLEHLLTESTSIKEIRSTLPFVLGLTADLERDLDQLFSHLDTFEKALNSLYVRGEEAYAEVRQEDVRQAQKRRNAELAGLTIPLALAILLFAYAERRRRRRNHQLVAAAEHDLLTGLPNRFALQRNFGVVPEGPPVAPNTQLLLVDLDHFKAINDAFGHHVGDGVLVEFSQRIRTLIRDDEQIFRLGGDEFVVLCSPETDKTRTRELAASIRQALQEPINLVRHSLRLEVSCGAATSSKGTKLSDLLIEADLALHEVKESGRGSFLHYEETRRGPLIRKLPPVLESQRLEFVFQPQVNLRTGKISGLEGLCRWPRDLGTELFAPIDVIDSVEWLGHTDRFLNNLIFRFEEAHQLAGDRFDGRFWVNVWPSQLEAPDLERSLRATFRRSSLPMSRLGIEITEKRVIVDGRRSRETVEELRREGVAVALDDFGVFNASIDRLTSLPLDVVKLDHKLIHGLSNKLEHHLYVNALREISLSLGLKVIAEGVEDSRSLDTLRNLGVDEVQGIFVCPPLFPEELAVFLEDWDSAQFLSNLSTRLPA